jgi:long-chain fatty acid transport protein
MKKDKFISIILLMLLALLIPSASFGHGWACYEQGAKAHGLGGAFTGLADDPTAVYYNPAGVTQLDGTQASLGFSFVTARGTFESAGTSGMPGISAGDETDFDEQYFLVPNLYLTSKINDRLSIGFGEYTIYGLGFEWPDSFEGRFAPGGKNGELATMTLSPVVAYQFTDRLSLAAGARVERADITYENNLFVAPGVPEVRGEISGDDYGFGWNAGLLCKLTDTLSAGLSYRSKMKHSFESIDLDFNPQIETIGDMPVGIVNTGADLDVTLPQYVSAGLAWSKGPLTLTADGYWWDWSELDELNFQFDDPVAGQASQVTPMNWQDSCSWAIGAEYKVNACDREISLRGGFMREESPIPSATVSPIGYQGDNFLYNLGLGSMIGPVYSDFFFTYVYTKDRTWNNAFGSAPNPGGGPVTGEFKDYNSFIIGSNITYKF